MTPYLRYIIKNIEPLRISDYATSQRGQTNTLRWIPGSAVRGMVVDALSELPEFTAVKRIVFHEPVAFLNAYPYIDNRSLIPSPKGFYEDKSIVEGKKSVDNVVIKGDFEDGLKRASLGQFCYLEEDCIHYYGVNTSLDMKILMNPGKDQKRNVFRLETIEPGQCFEGYIRLSEDEEINEEIRKIFSLNNIIRLGNARSSGLGKCKVLFSEEVDKHYAWQEDFSVSGDCYMILLSDTVMRDANGELCGLDKDVLEQKMGVSNLRIHYASTSIRAVHGFNRTWGTRLPSMNVYEAGSVFHMTFCGELTKERMDSIRRSGIGIRLNEGFGQILFLSGYEDIRFKQASSDIHDITADKTTDSNISIRDAETIKTVAKRYYTLQLKRKMQEYVLRNPLTSSGIPNSQIGSIEAALLQFRYRPEKAEDYLERFFAHADDKEKKQRIQKEKASVGQLGRMILRILKTPLEETLLAVESHSDHEGILKDTIMGIPKSELFTKEDDRRFRVMLLIDMIRFDRKKEM